LDDSNGHHPSKDGVSHNSDPIKSQQLKRVVKKGDSPATVPRNSQVIRSIAIMSLAMVFLPLMDIIAKYLSASMATGQIAWSRFLFQSLLLAPFAWRVIASTKQRPVHQFDSQKQAETTLPSQTKRRPHVVTIKHSLLPNRWQLHALRGFLIAAATLCFFSSVTRLPVADAIAIFFVEPLLLTLLSPIFLGEKIGWRRLSAVVTGFTGALIIIKPGAAVFGVYAFLPLAAALCFAFYLILTRKLALDTDPILIQFFTGLSGLFFMSTALITGALINSLEAIDLNLFFLQTIWPDSNQWALMALLGTIGCLGHLAVVYAFRYIDASTLAPLQYFEIVGAALFGWLVFSDVPTVNTWVGIAIITGSGFYVYWREKTLAKKNAGNT